MRIAASIGLAWLLLSATPAAAWTFLGQREVGQTVDRDAIIVSDGRAYSRIRICVERQPVHFIDLDVTFRNGGHQDVPVRALIAPEQCTREIRFPGGRRFITRINFVYEVAGVPPPTKPRVRVYGEQ
jgi:hypothetical protein